MYLVKRIGSGIEVFMHDKQRDQRSREQQCELRLGRWLVYVVVELFNEPLSRECCRPVVDFTRAKSLGGIEVTLFRRLHVLVDLERAAGWLGLPKADGG